MTGGDDDYGDAFKEAKLEHDQRRQGSGEEQRLQAEVDADAAIFRRANSIPCSRFIAWYDAANELCFFGPRRAGPYSLSIASIVG
jgi:hypothetical protein